MTIPSNWLLIYIWPCILITGSRCSFWLALPTDRLLNTSRSLLLLSILILSLSLIRSKSFLLSKGQSVHLSFKISHFLPFHISSFPLTHRFPSRSACYGATVLGLNRLGMVWILSSWRYIILRLWLPIRLNLESLTRRNVTHILITLSHWCSHSTVHSIFISVVWTLIKD